MTHYWESVATNALQRERKRHSVFVTRISLLVTALVTSIAYLIHRLVQGGCSLW